MSVRYSATYNVVAEEKVDFVDRIRANFVENEGEIDKTRPYVVEALIQEETANTLIMDVMYHVPEDTKGVHVLTVRPERSDFVSNDVSMEKGTNFARVTVFYDPKNLMKRRVLTEYLFFTINSHGDKSDVEENVIQANLAKTWRKPRRNGFLLKRTEFHTR